MPLTRIYDTLVIGSGAAGLSLALRLAQAGQQVLVIAKREIAGGSTLWAQGGISAVLDADDSIASHVADTMNAGGGLCVAPAVELAASRGAACVRWLCDQGVPFTRCDDDSDSARYHLHQEGGHSHRRIIHAADATGRAVETTLANLAHTHPGISLNEAHVAIDLICLRDSNGSSRCAGAYILNTRKGNIESVAASNVVLASGGANMAYLYSSNPLGASGDGIAMAWRAGCRVADMEFMQFHPTCLYHADSKSFLISEALRGEGAVLIHADGTRFMPRFDERAELAPRDIVARAIDHEMKRLGVDCVYLDISHRSDAFIESHFPNISARCREYGFDLARGPIPVVPAAHYTCGGIVTDLNARTDVAHLYAVGETACTGLHGANRMASNSLLECLVFSEAAANDILSERGNAAEITALPDWDESRVTDSDEEVVVSHNWHEVRRLMWDYVGIVRSDKRLRRARNRLDLLQQEIHEYYADFRISPGLAELRNLVVVAGLIVDSALMRHESRGLHFNIDYPETSDNAHHSVLKPGNFSRHATFIRPTGLAALVVKEESSRTAASLPVT